MDDDQRHAQRLLEERFLAPQAAIAQMKAVIAHEHDDGVLPEVEPVERLQDEADVGIGERDAGEIGRDALRLRRGLGADGPFGLQGDLWKAAAGQPVAARHLAGG